MVRKANKTSAEQGSPTTTYRGKRTRTGNSLGFRFESAFFRSHPEFSGDVKAHVIAPGRLLVTAEPRDEQRDEVMASFLAFLAQDIASTPHHVSALDCRLVNDMERLTGQVSVSPDEDLGEESLI